MIRQHSPMIGCGDRENTMIGTMVGTKSILVVEDNLEINRLFCKLLRNRGYDVEGTYSIHHAADYLEMFEPPDLVILDLQLEDGPGTAILTLLQDKRFKDTHVIVVSANAYSQKHKLHPYSIDHVLLKPVSPRGLVALVTSMLA